MTKRSYWEQSNANPARRRAVLEAAIPADRSGCWEWRGTRTAGGYGQMRGGSKVKLYVHRASYETFVGPIPDGLTIDHLCRNRACFNPAHLEPVTMGENTRRGNAPGMIAMRTNRCKSKRHDLAGDNVLLHRNGARQCRACLAEWYEKRRQERKAASNTAEVVGPSSAATT